MRPALRTASSGVTWYVSATSPARHRAAVVDDVVDGHPERVVVALDHHAERVAHEQQVSAGLVEDARERGIVGGHHHQGLTALGGTNGGDGDGGELLVDVRRRVGEDPAVAGVANVVVGHDGCGALGSRPGPSRSTPQLAPKN
jgi:hypothetical protein